MGLLNKKEKKAKKSKKPFRIENLYSMREVDEDEFKQPPKPDPLWDITPVKIKDLEIGKGKPVICLSIAGETVDDISRQTKKAAESEADLIE